MVPEVTPEQIEGSLQNFMIVDVRRPSEFNDELGHIAGAKLATLGPEFTSFLAKADKNKEMLIVCRSGGRSANATIEALEAGFKAKNLSGGMLAWNASNLPVERS